MKKVAIGILLIISMAIIVFFAWYHRNLQQLKDIQSFNQEYEDYLNKMINGVDLTTIMNKAIENNHRYSISKNVDGSYQNDGKYAIIIWVKPVEGRKFLSNGSF